MIVADESVDGNIVAHLESQNRTVHYIKKHNSGINDFQVLEIAIEHEALLITEDKDFGELVHRLRLPHCGILLLRLSGMDTKKKCVLVESALQQYAVTLKNKFSVLDENKLRTHNEK